MSEMCALPSCGQDAPGASAKELRRSFWQRRVDALFGYDFFISYAHADGKNYARPLACRLQQQHGFDCFLDVQDYSSGDNWQMIGEWALKRTAILVLVGSPKAFESKPVLREAVIFSRAGKRIIPIDFGGSFSQAHAQGNALSACIPLEVLRVCEPAEGLQTGPSEDAMQKIVGAWKGMRQRLKRRRWFQVFLLLLVALLTVAGLLWQQVHREGQEARYQEGKAWLERARYHEGRRDFFATQIMAATAQGFVGFGREQRGSAFAKEHPIFLQPSQPEWRDASRILSRCAGNGIPLFQIFASTHPPRRGALGCV